MAEVTQVGAFCRNPECAIETLFDSCKSRGFCLARTPLTGPERIDRLILAIALAT